MQRFRGNLLGILSMLILQFLLGMGVNLFVTITRHHPGANPPEFFGGAVQSVFWAATQGPVVLILHTILGLLLVINSVVILVGAFRLPSTATRVLASFGVLGIVGAGFNGASFLNYNQDVNSYLMSVGFALAAVVYTQLLYMLPAPIPSSSLSSSDIQP
jgi:hypothetical protein